MTATLKQIEKKLPWFSFDPELEIVTLFGIRYTLGFFKDFGAKHVGFTFKIAERGDGVVTITQQRSAVEAAAHEMLAALQAMVRVAEGQGSRWRTKLPDGNSPLGLAYAALEKATGQSPATPSDAHGAVPSDEKVEQP